MRRNLAVIEKVRRSARHFNWWSIKDHMQSNIAGYEFDLIEGQLTWFERMTIRWDVLRMRVDATICEWRGHDYTTSGVDYPDSGGEGFACRRCGHTFIAWH